MDLFGVKNSASRGSRQQKLMDEFAVDDWDTVFLVVGVEGEIVIEREHRELQGGY